MLEVSIIDFSITHFNLLSLGYIPGNYPSGAGDIDGSLSLFNSPLGLSWLASNIALYVSDTLNNNVKRIIVNGGYTVSFMFYVPRPIGLVYDIFPTIFAISYEDNGEYYIHGNVSVGNY